MVSKHSGRLSTYSVFASALLHGAVFLLFLMSPPSEPQRLHGQVAVEFISPVSHEASVQKTASVGKKTFRSKPKTSIKSEAVPQSSTVSGQQEGPAISGDPNAPVRETDLYIQQVTELINKNKIYPAEAVSRDQEGRVVIGVTIQGDGEIVSSTLEEKCSFGRLNQEALETVKRVGRFPPLPPHVTEPLHLHIPLIFRIERS